MEIKSKKKCTWYRQSQTEFLSFHAQSASDEGLCRETMVVYQQWANMAYGGTTVGM